jgi:hypothetical protein
MELRILRGSKDVPTYRRVVYSYVWDDSRRKDLEIVRPVFSLVLLR